ncbi:tRNA (uridine(54)-C5)-methyltransferase TrmA [Conchiformibius kuhniae]|uniref:tRNA/tmRNA (uracil-C(5))-methyltransferase n=1 Tax=Conchiformibius kuhniae TaxID=211502 RepID=A0A8T9MVE2_9NEIS|nr:tRNA (uridine(54)-C5)-methyltransferase TrmA [Conchiformibius kuhniae]UOP05084.1 tRNA (uridine(54)-C5)-methyltransferase TrmA [Conchiformibius kuhniae]
MYHAYSAQLADKTARLQHLLAPFAAPAPEVFASPPQHYRMRAEFRIWHDGDEICYAMFERGQKANRHSLIRLTEFPAACDSINAMMPRLLAAVRADEVLRERLYQCEFLATLSGEMLITLIYHKKLDDAWQAAVQRLQDGLGVWLIGRSRGQKIVLTQDFVTESLNVCGETLRYRQIEGGFSQPNALMCQEMLSWSCACAENVGGDLLELYCGNGNFTVPLSRRFRRVLATELSKTSVRAAQWNLSANGADNVDIARLSAEELAQAFSGSRAFRRLAEQNIDLHDFDFSTVLVDPPRAGVDADTLRLLRGFRHILYISCNPHTLADNLAQLGGSHRVLRCALFDQFPFTEHIECGVFLQSTASA